MSKAKSSSSCVASTNSSLLDPRIFGLKIDKECLGLPKNLAQTLSLEIDLSPKEALEFLDTLEDDTDFIITD